MSKFWFQRLALMLNTVNKASWRTLRKVHLKAYCHPIVCFYSNIQNSKCEQNKIQNESDSTSIERTDEQKFVNILDETNFLVKPAILIDEDEQLTQTRRRSLTRQQKQLLKLWLPQNKEFKARMTLSDQLTYKDTICEQLYEVQKEQLGQAIRIIQDIDQSSTMQPGENSEINLDGYVNLLYKDIYARYLLARGIGVEWQMPFKNAGTVTASYSQAGTNLQLIRQELYRGLFDIFQHTQLQFQTTIGLYSSMSLKFVTTDDVDVENITKIGYFNTIELTDFGKFASDFQIVKGKQAKLSLIIFTEYLEKLIDMDAVCLSEGKMAILEHTQSNSYFITSLDVYQTHLTFFEKNKIRKKSAFQGKYLLGMKCGQKKLPIIPQIQGYSRKTGLYSVCGSTNLSDFERLTQYGINPKESFIDKNSQFSFGQRTFSLRDPTYTQRLHDAMCQRHSLEGSQSEPIEFLDLYETFQDQIYSHAETKQPLHFRTSNNKLIIPISSNPSIQRIKDSLLQILDSHDYIQESKIEIPRQRIFHKPRQKRHFQKDVKELQKQKTEYRTLAEAVEEMQEITVSSINSIDDGNSSFSSSFSFPIIHRRDQDGGKVMLKYPADVVSQIKEYITAGDVQWSQTHIDNLTNIAKNVHQDCQVSIIELSQRFIRSLLYYRQTNQLGADENNSNQVSLSQRRIASSIIMEPQTTTESNLPSYLMVGMLAKNVQAKLSMSQKKGRRLSPRSMENEQLQAKFPYSLIKLHPTLDEAQRNRPIQEILLGVKKANKKEQYGYGLEAMRLWLAKNDNFLGDRFITEKSINQELKFATFLRKLYWQLLPLIKSERLSGNLEMAEFYPPNELRPSDGESPAFLDRFIIHHIDYYILNMQHYYSTMDLHGAYTLTWEFFKQYIDEIYMNTVRKNSINFHYWHAQDYRQKVFARIVSLLAVLSPIIPFSAFHVTKQPLMKWPQINAQLLQASGIFNQIQYYNRFVKFRVELTNRIKLNRFRHVWVQIEVLSTDQEQGQVKPLEIPVEELAQFLGVDKASHDTPPILGKRFKIQLKKGFPFNVEAICRVFDYDEHCLRCDQKSQKVDLLCGRCEKYIKENI